VSSSGALSPYAEGLSEEAKSEKLSFIRGVDSFAGVVGELYERTPPVECIDIIGFVDQFCNSRTAESKKGS